RLRPRSGGHRQALVEHTPSIGSHHPNDQGPSPAQELGRGARLAQRLLPRAGCYWTSAQDHQGLLVAPLGGRADHTLSSRHAEADPAWAWRSTASWAKQAVAVRP